MRKLLYILFSFIAINSYSQTYVTKDTTIDGWLARISYISGNTDSTNLFIILHGNGEVGSGTNNSQSFGPHYWVNNGWNLTIALGNGTHRPVYVTLQPPSAQPQPTALKPKVDAIISRFKVKAGGLHLMGFSGGAWSWGEFVTYKPTSNDFTYYNYAQTVTLIESVEPSTTYGSSLALPQKFGNLAVKNPGIKFLGFQQGGMGVWNMDKYFKNVSDSVGAGRSFFYITNFGASDHCCFNSFYNPSETNWTLTNADVQLNGYLNVIPTTPFAGGQNIFQWALRQSRDTSLVAALSNSAGTDQSITLPTSSVTLAGTESGGSTPYTRAWTRISGPNTPTIVSSTSLSTSVTGLIQGTYVFRLTTTDNVAASTFDEVSIVVNPLFVPSVNIMADVAPGEYAINWIKNDGTVYTIAGGDGGFTVQQVAGLTNIVEGVGGQYNTVLRNSSNQVFSVIGGTTTYTSYPLDNTGAAFTADKIDALYRNIIAIKNGEVWYWSAMQSNPANNEDILNQYGGVAQNTPRKLIQPAGKTITKTAAFSSTSYGTLTYLWGMASDGTVWQWDRSNTTPFQVTGWGTSNNARNITLGAFSKFIETTTNQIYAWGYRADAVGAQASWQNPNPQNITSVWTGAGVTLPIKDIVGTYNTIMVIDANDNLYGAGTNAQGEIGNGVQWPSWRTYPSNSSSPYGWQWIVDDNLTSTPVQVPGKWLNIDGSSSIAFYMYGQDMNSNWYSWGRGKARTLGNGIAQLSNDESTYPEYYNIPAPRLITPLTQTWVVQGASNPNTNRTPIANAGINQYLILGTTSTTLYGSGSHQQQPTHNATTITMTNAWTRVSGPNTPTITTPTAQNTTVTGMVTGTYVFRNTVTSSYGTDSRDVTVVVQTTNLLPTANAGPDQSITLPTNTVTVSGLGTDPDGTIATYGWSKVSGPSGDAISTPSSQSTDITFTTSGTYIYRLTVTDNSGGVDTNDMQVIVSPAPPVRVGFKRGRIRGR
jgi:hypothetical protein